MFALEYCFGRSARPPSVSGSSAGRCPRLAPEEASVYVCVCMFINNQDLLSYAHPCRAVCWAACAVAS
jgi:hypothetical protein